MACNSCNCVNSAKVQKVRWAADNERERGIKHQHTQDEGSRVHKKTTHKKTTDWLRCVNLHFLLIWGGIQHASKSSFFWITLGTLVTVQLFRGGLVPTNVCFLTCNNQCIPNYLLDARTRSRSQICLSLCVGRQNADRCRRRYCWRVQALGWKVRWQVLVLQIITTEHHRAPPNTPTNAWNRRTPPNTNNHRTSLNF